MLAVRWRTFVHFVRSRSLCLNIGGLSRCNKSTKSSIEELTIILSAPLYVLHTVWFFPEFTTAMLCSWRSIGHHPQAAASAEQCHKIIHQAPRQNFEKLTKITDFWKLHRNNCANIQQKKIQNWENCKKKCTVLTPLAASRLLSYHFWGPCLRWLANPSTQKINKL